MASSCFEDAAKLEEKWQLHEMLYADGRVEQEDSVFSNFQKGSFSAICLLLDGSYQTFFGTYALQDDKISIILLSEYRKEWIEERLNWSEYEQTFFIEELSSSTLRFRNEKMDLNSVKY